MSVLLYILAYVAFLAFVAIIVMKIIDYKKKPVHLRWELYPVPHETGGRADYGGSYFEKTGWWKQKQEHSMWGAIKYFLIEALTMKLSFEHNRQLWYRTYPFHMGLYLLFASLVITILCSFMANWGYSGWFYTFCRIIAMLCNIGGFLGVLGGSLGLLIRRLTTPDLKKFSMYEHYFNLCLFILFSGLGFIQCGMSPLGFTDKGIAFFSGMLTFSAAPTGFIYSLYMLISCLLFIWVPFSFMGHFFMKFFTWHDIRWGDTPSQDDPKIQAEMAETLKFPVDWKGSHIQGDGKKNWGEVATTLPGKQESK